MLRVAQPLIGVEQAVLSLRKGETMEQWQLEALQKLLEDAIVNEVEKGQRVYTSSSTYGSSRYHLLEKVYGGIQIEQMDVDEKWSKRVNLYTDELPAVLKTLFLWYLEEVRTSQEAASADGDDRSDHPF